MIETTENKINFIIQTSRVFDFDIPFFDEDDIRCFSFVGGTQRELVRGTDFTVSHYPEHTDFTDGGKITLLGDLPPAGTKLVIARILDLTQDVDLPLNGKLPSVSVETQLDKIVCMLQQNAEVLTRCVKLAIASGISPDVLIDEIFAAHNDAVAKAAEAAQSAQSASDDATSAAVSAVEAREAAEEAKSVSKIEEHNADATAHPGIRQSVTALQNAVNGKAPLSHNHAPADITSTSTEVSGTITTDGCFYMTTSSNVTLNISGIALGKAAILRIDNSGGHVVTYADSEIITTEGIYFVTFVNLTGTVELASVTEKE